MCRPGDADNGVMKKTVGLLVTCLVDVQRPSVAFAALELLEAAGCLVDVPQQQTCCGQPAYNNGDRASSRLIAQQVIRAFEGFDYCVAPSASCLGMVKVHYPELFEPGSAWHQRALALAKRSFELSEFLCDVLNKTEFGSQLQATLAYHDSCSGLRELNIFEQPRKLLANVKGLVCVTLEDYQVCCGFGGTFSLKFPDVSGHMVEQKCQHILATQAAYVAAGDLGCLLNIEGRLQRSGSDIKVYHWAEIVAGLDTF